MKHFEISYNPYSNRIHFRQVTGQSEDGKPEWGEIELDSDLREFQEMRCIFENCAEEILEHINKYINASGELTIEFIGTDEDFYVLKYVVEISKNPKSKGIICEHKEQYPSASDALFKIKEAYKQIESEFKDYIDNDELTDDDERKIIGRSVLKFQDTIRAEIPVCVIGNYSVGKSALVNALIGMEILPSHIDSTTAKNARIQNGSEFALESSYKGQKFKLLIKGGTVTPENAEMDQELLTEMLNGTDGLNSEEQLLHQIIENLNKETGMDSRIAEMDDSVDVTVPFVPSELDTKKYSFIFIDTPGSNNNDDAKRIHRENLERLMHSQTNALPIFVTERKSLTTNDINDLIDLLMNKEKDGFSIYNCMFAISMSDQLVEQQLSEELPEKVKQSLNHPTIMYVSPVAGIGAKKPADAGWIDRAYQQLFEKKMDDIVEVSPPKYNETPCRRKMSDSRIKDISPMLYASGIPSLETEINYFAYRFAEFKKCTKGREYLLTALDLADEKLKESKEQLSKEKAEQVKEQAKIRNGILKKINAVPIPAVNRVISSVRGRFDSALIEYCATVESVVRTTWEKTKSSNQGMDVFEAEMAAHCQTNLYDAHIGPIKKEIEDKLIDLTADYMGKVQECVTQEYGKLSDKAQKELNKMFSDEKDNGPKLTDVKIGAFKKIALSILGILPFDWAQDRCISQYSKTFCDKLKGNDKNHGKFDLQCIVYPAREYSKQIQSWSEGYKGKINETLNKDNAVLSELDDKILEMEEMIADMQSRLNNLESVKTALMTVIPVEGGGDDNG